MCCQWLRKLATKEGWLQPRAPDIGIFFWVMYVIGIGSYIGTFAMNINSLVNYASSDEWWYFSILLTAVVLPQVPINLFSFWWYRNDSGECYVSWPNTVGHCLLLAVPIRMGEIGKIACRTRSKEKGASYYHRFFLAQADLSFLRLVAVYAGSASQLVVKIYKLLSNWTGVESALLEMVFGALVLVSLALSTFSMGQHCRSHRHDKQELSYASTVLQVLYRICFLASRVFALACLFHLGITYGICVCVGAFIVCIIWFHFMETEFTENWKQERFYHALMAYLHIFGMFNVKDDPARYRYAFYYSVSFFVEALVYAVYALGTGRTFVCLFPGLFLVGLLCHGLEHECFHPGGRLYMKRAPAEWENVCEECAAEASDSAAKERAVAAEAL
ncbi:XK-related protein 8-like [Amphibalanus amphitrite]|nr:XK-related protein 8-like [Amphibalanus amphitrite]XP_043208817.1 XK-related protein 8-like [Amphibalanus amphitrite]XP_043208819.1 XK-related protein 8-like [Amphibalanus amphitrite]